MNKSVRKPITVDEFFNLYGKRRKYAGAGDICCLCNDIEELVEGISIKGYPKRSWICRACIEQFVKHMDKVACLECQLKPDVCDGSGCVCQMKRALRLNVEFAEYFNAKKRKALQFEMVHG